MLYITIFQASLFSCRLFATPEEKIHFVKSLPHLRECACLDRQSLVKRGHGFINASRMRATYNRLDISRR